MEIVPYSVFTFASPVYVLCVCVCLCTFARNVTLGLIKFHMHFYNIPHDTVYEQGCHAILSDLLQWLTAVSLQPIILK